MDKDMLMPSHPHPQRLASSAYRVATTSCNCHQYGPEPYLTVHLSYFGFRVSPSDRKWGDTTPALCLAILKVFLSGWCFTSKSACRHSCMRSVLSCNCAVTPTAAIVFVTRQTLGCMLYSVHTCLHTSSDTPMFGCAEYVATNQCITQ